MKFARILLLGCVMLFGGVTAVMRPTRTQAQPLVQTGPSLQVAPTCQTPGSKTMTISGLNWPANETIQLNWGTPTTPPAPETTVSASALGAFLLKLPKTMLSGVYTIEAISPSYTLTRTVLVDPTCTSPIFQTDVEMVTSRNVHSGAVNLTNLSPYGPHSCTAYGDPYSPLNSPWNPSASPYSYQYRIHIPATYPSNVVRVELFDPDSINQATNTTTIAHTIYALNQGFPAAESRVCSSTNQRDSCLIDTGERIFLNEPTVPLDWLNILWLMRIDENRGTGTPPGNGNCGLPANYNPAYNTQTLFHLYAYAPDRNGYITRVDIANYTGQTGDGLRDTGNHNTDLRWVSPGGTLSMDQPVYVPIDPNSPHTFEVDLSQDVPGLIVDPVTGERVLYLDITTLSGASENGFEIWAGPKDTVTTVPSNVNARNVYLANNPGSHDSMGVEVTAVHSLPLNLNDSNRRQATLITLTPADAGRLVTVTSFDMDISVQRPLTFYFDTIPLAQWSQSFGVVAGSTDPDGVPANGRCFPNCNNQWITPAYQIIIPTSINGQPFPGGHLMLSSQYGTGDTVIWQVEMSPPADEFVTITSGPHTGDMGQAYGFTAVSSFITPTETITYHWDMGDSNTFTHTAGLSDTAVYTWSTSGWYTITLTAQNGLTSVTTQYPVHILGLPSCTAYPIAPSIDLQSLNAPGGGANPYPAANEFDYPVNPPDYPDFMDNLPNVSLGYARNGYIYKFNDSDSPWLVWNDGINASSATLANSLTIPGDVHTYANLGDGGQPITPLYPWVVRGYVNPNDPYDLSLDQGDWSIRTTTPINSSAVRIALEALIDTQEIVRLPIWQNSNTNLFQIDRFGYFRVHGYHLSQSGLGSWLLLEYVHSSGNCPSPQVGLDGPSTGQTAVAQTFTATVEPITTTLPITYTWQANGQSPIVQSSGLSTTAVYSWTTPGVYTVTVSAENAFGLTTAFQAITITQAPIPLTELQLSGPTTGQEGEAMPLTATVEPANVSQPITYTWQVNGQTAVTMSGGISVTAVYSWTTAGIYPVMVWASNGLNMVTATTAITITQVSIPLTELQLSGPATGQEGEVMAFTATVAPANASQPITYTWQVDGQEPLTNTGSIMATAVYTWPTAGVYTLTVGADNGFNMVTATAVITITHLNFTLDLAGPTEGILNTPYVFTATVEPITTPLPMTYTWQTDGQAPIVQSGGLSTTAVYSWTAPGTYTLTVTATNAFGTTAVTHTLTITARPESVWYIYLPIGLNGATRTIHKP